MRYRAEIDGLRAIAVLSVVFYHAQIVAFGRDWFAGGFIGVDIFFVISGYLITRILLHEMAAENFRFLNFYERRARRILPMLVFMMAVCLPFAWLKLLPLDLVEFSQSAIAALLFVSNFFFYFATTEYGTDSALLKPLLHTWTLGIEEQFYILAPVLLLLAWKFAKRFLLVILLALLFSSILFAERMSVQNAELNFFLPFSRFWELLFGSVIAYVEMNYGLKRLPPVVRVLPAVGLLLIAYSIVFFDTDKPHPSFYSLIPIVGVGCIIAFCSAEDWLGRVLSSRGLVAIGLVSYSAYLWHYPIFAFSRLGVETPSLYDKFGWMIATFVLSALTFRFIEKPFRNRQQVSRKLFLSTLGIFLLALVSVNGLYLQNAGYSHRVPPILSKANLEAEPWRNFKQDGKECHNRETDFCSVEVGEDAISVFAFGDSQLSSMSLQIISSLKGEFNYLEANVGSCPFVLHMDIYKKSGSLIDSCGTEFQNTRLAQLPQKPAIVLIGGRFPVYLSGRTVNKAEGAINELSYRFQSTNGKTFAQEFTATVAQLIQLGHQVVLVYPLPEVGIHVPNFIFKQTVGKDTRTINTEFNPLTTSYDTYQKRTASTFDLFDSIEGDAVHRVYPHRLFCNRQIKGRCVTHDESNVYYVDGNHPSATASEKIAKQIQSAIAEAVTAIRKQK